VSSVFQFVLNAISVATQGAAAGPNPLAGVLPTFAELCAQQMPEAWNTASAPTTSADEPNSPANSVSPSGPALPLPPGKTRTASQASQDSSAEAQLGVSTLAIPIPVVSFAPVLPEPVATGAWTGSAADSATGSSAAQSSGFSGVVPISGNLSGLPGADSATNLSQSDSCNPFTLESTGPMTAVFASCPRPAAADSLQSSSSTPASATSTAAVQCVPEESDSGDATQPMAIAVAETSFAVESASLSSRPPLPEIGAAQVSTVKDTRSGTIRSVEAGPLGQCPEQPPQVAIAEAQPVISQPQVETAQSGAIALGAVVAAVKVPLPAHVATGAGPSPDADDLSAYPPKTGSGSAGSSLPVPTLSATVHQAASVQNLPPVATHISNVSLASTTSFVEARGPKLSSTNAASANSASPRSSQTSSVTASSKSSPSNGDGGNSSDNSQHKEATASGSSMSTALATNASIPPPASDVSPSLPAAAVVVGGASASPQPLPSSSARADAPTNSHEPVLDLPADTLPAPVSPAPVQMAQMVNRAAQAEMRIGMNTSEFGSVEVRTVVHANDVGLQIGSERGDLRSLLSSEIPSIANTLQQQNLRLTQVNFHQQGFNFTGNSPGGGNPPPRSFATRANAAMQSVAETSPESPQMEAPRTSGTSSLSVLA